MNGNWYPWSATQGQSSPQDYVNMWRRVHNLFETQCGMSKALMANTLKWVWSPIDFDVGDFKMEQYYPGDDVVDWAGTTGFNWGTSESWSGWWGPTELYAVTIPRLRAIVNNKPIGITEYSSVTAGQGIAGKTKWMNDLFAFIQTYDIRMVAYFNLDKNEGSSGGLKDWSVFGGSTGDSTYWDAATNTNYNCLSSYKAGVQNRFIVGSDASNSRVISDAQFAGFITAPKPVLPVVSNIVSDIINIPNDLPNNGATKDLVVFQDAKVGVYNFLVWGAPGVQASPVYSSQGAEPTSIEGSTSMKVHSADWGGAGFFVQPGSMSYMSLAGYTKLRFSVASSVPVRIEIQDRSGKKFAQVVKPTSEAAWRSVSISMTRIGAVIDLNEVYGLFLATTAAAGDFLIDNVRYSH